jgi:hypothetical protein
MAHIANIEGPLIVGMDANHWNLRTTLDLPEAPPESDAFYSQTLFFSAGAKHGLRDALLVYLEADPAKHEELVRLRPEGPLEVTHSRGGHGVPDRFDYLMISKEFRVDEMPHDYEGARRAGSDHGWGVRSALPRRRVTRPGKPLGIKSGIKLRTTQKSPGDPPAPT